MADAEEEQLNLADSLECWLQVDLPDSLQDFPSVSSESSVSSDFDSNSQQDVSNYLSCFSAPVGDSSADLLSFEAQAQQYALEVAQNQIRVLETDEQFANQDYSLPSVNDPKQSSTKNSTQLHQCFFEDCQAAFSKHPHLLEHTRIHTGEKPFKCQFETCGKVFRHKGTLTIHVRMHTGERPYVCRVEDCHKSFTSRGHLTMHVRSHLGIRPYKCAFQSCTKMFKQSHHLRAHLHTHRDDENTTATTPVSNDEQST